MPNVFKSAVAVSIGTTETVAYTAPASTTTTVIGFSVANVSASAVTCTVRLRKNAGTFANIIKDAPVPVGGALVAIGGDQKVVLETGDSIRVTSSAATSLDSIASVLEIS